MPKHRAPRYVRTKKTLSRAPLAAGATIVGLGVFGAPATAQASPTTPDWSGVDAHGQPVSGFTGAAFSAPGTEEDTTAGHSRLAAPAGSYTVAPGDTLAGIAAALGQPWRELYHRNADVLGADPNLLFPGQVLATTGPAAGGTAGDPAPPTAPAPQAAPAPEPAAVAPVAGHGRLAAPAGSYTVAPGDTLAGIAAALGQPWRELYHRNADVLGADPNLLFPGQVLATTGPAAGGTAGAAAPAPEPAPVAPVAPVAAVDAVAHISNSAGALRPQAQAAANAVVSDVPGAASITLNGTRASAVDPHGHPSGLAVDYMVMADSALGDAIAQYHIAHWNELGVEYVIWEQRLLTSPGGAWQEMEDRGSATANHMDHPHVNYRG